MKTKHVSDGAHYGPRLPSDPSVKFFTNLPLADTRFCSLDSRSFARSLGVLPLPATIAGKAVSMSPLEAGGLLAVGSGFLPAR